MYVSSLWCRRDDRWVNVFSQDTPAESRASNRYGAWRSRTVRARAAISSMTSDLAFA